VPAWMQIFSSTNYSILCRRSGRRCVCVCFLMGEMKRVLVFCSTQTYFAHGSMRDQCLAFGAKLTNSLLKLIGDRGLKIVMFQKQFLLSAVPKALRYSVTIPLLGLGKACYLADGLLRNLELGSIHLSLLLLRWWMCIFQAVLGMGRCHPMIHLISSPAFDFFASHDFAKRGRLAIFHANNVDVSIVQPR